MASAAADAIRMTGPGHPFARRRRARGWWWLIAALLLLPVMLLASRGVLGRSGEGEGYSVSVPVTLKPYDPQIWSLVNADSFEAARQIDPDLPDPTSVPTVMEAGASIDPTAPVAAMPMLPPLNTPARMEAYVGPSAQPYVFRGATATDTARAHYCLTAALYYEAASESDDGMRGVAQVVLNRTRHPSFPGSVCGVVFQGSQRAIVCQFTFACDGAMAREPNRGVWSRASRIAAEALAGRVFPAVGLATHYHTQAVWPSWGKSLIMTNIVGAHIFHRWRGRWGMPAAFSRPYSGREPVPGPYLPISAQLAARAGRSGPAVILPAGMSGGNAMAIAPLLVGPVSPALAPTPQALPQSMGAPAVPQPGFSGEVANSPAPVPRNAPAYADPRLAGSGSVREEYRSSGSYIAR